MRPFVHALIDPSVGAAASRSFDVEDTHPTTLTTGLQALGQLGQLGFLLDRLAARLFASTILIAFTPSRSCRSALTVPSRRHYAQGKQFFCGED